MATLKPAANLSRLPQHPQVHEPALGLHCLAGEFIEIVLVELVRRSACGPTWQWIAEKDLPTVARGLLLHSTDSSRGFSRSYAELHSYAFSPSANTAGL
jgi:hypothetical protein